MKYVNETPREKVLRAHRLYEEIKSWYFSLSERDKEYYREYNPLLISTVELIIFQSFLIASVFYLLYVL